jgi:hypothetical protein
MCEAKLEQVAGSAIRNKYEANRHQPKVALSLIDQASQFPASSRPAFKYPPDPESPASARLSSPLYQQPKPIPPCRRPRYVLFQLRGP